MPNECNSDITTVETNAGGLDYFQLADEPRTGLRLLRWNGATQPDYENRVYVYGIAAVESPVKLDTNRPRMWRNCAPQQLRKRKRDKTQPAPYLVSRLDRVV